MARPREFDEDAVLDAAAQCFWARGYEATSVRDLAGKMNITGASLYNAFGDKRSLYRRALDYYVDKKFRVRVERLEATLPPRQAVGAFFNEIIELSLADPQRRGCMMVNSALEVPPNDPELQRAIGEILTLIEDFFLRCVTAGQRTGAIATEQPAADLARMLFAILLGIRVLARVRPERELLESLVRPAFALLRSPSTGNGKDLQ